MAELLDKKKILSVEKQQGFLYRHGKGELLYTMVTCRLDMSFLLTKINQYSAAPTNLHFKAVYTIYDYLKLTPDEGIYYWRQIPREDLEVGHIPQCPHKNNYATHMTN